MINVLHITITDIQGGASIAAYRLNNALNQYSNGIIKSKMRVGFKNSNNINVYTKKYLFKNFFLRLRTYIGSKIQSIQHTDNPISHSINILPSILNFEINNSEADIVHLHWIGAEFISIEAIGRISKPIVWTLHDSWPFCGSEHHPNGLLDFRYREGYYTYNRNIKSSGIDIDQYVWSRKINSWKNNISLIAPSTWMYNCAKESYLFNLNYISKIPNLLPIYDFMPSAKSNSRKKLSLPLDKILLLYGGNSLHKDINKGFDSLKSSLRELKKIIPNFILLIFGDFDSSVCSDLEFEFISLGRISNYKDLSSLYSASDLLLLPSKIETLPYVAMEAQSCGLPIVAFKTSGVTDVVDHLETGYLAKPFNNLDFTNGIKTLLENPSLRDEMSSKAREKAIKSWSPSLIVQLHINLYKKILEV
tara:strand:- start:91 stop:1347 length:1257 start_codon:yes stop_codon:yes gene_type:complete